MIQETLSDVIFTPHLGPFDRGILSTIHATLRPNISEAQVRETLCNRYASEPFVNILKAGDWPSVSAVQSSNRCDIGLAVDPMRQHLILSSAIDNLIKGAAGQAVQCMNIRFGFAETQGFLRLPCRMQCPSESTHDSTLTLCRQTRWRSS